MPPKGSKGPRLKDEPSVWVFEEADYSTPIPESIPTAPRSNALPFRAWFEKHGQAGVEGKQPHQFIAHRYWVEARNVEAAKATGSYAKQKLREQFKNWGDAEGKETHSKLNLVIIDRTGSEGIKGIEEPGISIWLQKKTA